MAYIADLHIHSRFSRACSQQLNIPNLVTWAKLKGINLLGTGDFLHPLWLSELKTQLKEDGSGFLHYDDSDIKFVLTVEIASIYSDKGKGRRIHNLIFLPDLQSANKLQKALLSKRATLGSDGRPIVGIPSKELLYMALEASDSAIFIPAHVWTPWFGIYGSMSGYDYLEDCFEDLKDKVHAIETGLSSDPGMNWRVKELDNRSIVSFSDAHSLPNLGREATIFSADLSQGYQAMLQELNTGNLAGTIEFYPEEGKYHYTGHRNCSVKYTPEDTKKKGITCPVCNRDLTEGVMERVEAVSSRSFEELKVKNIDGKITSEAFPKRPGYKMLVPLNQIIAEVFGVAKTSQKVEIEYKKIVTALGGEIRVLTKADLEEIRKIAGSKAAEGIFKVRKGDLVIDPGFDGVYGVVKIWQDGVESRIGNEQKAPQLGLFD